MKAGPASALDDDRAGLDSDFEKPQLRVTESQILVVDDIEWNRALIGTFLEDAGYTRIRYAVDGQDALNQIAENAPDLVILDIMMPGIDGYEVCRRLRADHAYADLPVLVQTALSGVEDRNRAFESGTTDLVTKPLDRTELMARVGIHLESRILIRNLQTYRDRLEGELAMARGIFEHLLPSAATRGRLEKASGLTLRSHMQRSSELGGDIWGTLDLNDGRFGVYLLDLAGRGVSAALNVCRLHTLVQELTGLGATPGAFLTELNRRSNDLLLGSAHASMIYGVVSPADNRFTYACAAANAPILLTDDATPQLGCSQGLPLGVVPDAQYDSCELSFTAGTAILLYSNAVLDALNNSGAGEAEQSLLGVAQRAMSGLSVTEGFPHLTQALDAIVGNPPKDDHVLVWLGR